MLCKMESNIEKEKNRRRTFAIISHPDAGKTTLTEKLLLFGGSIEIAGAVRGRKSQRAATSDWMDLEKKRGISVSSTVLTFEYGGHQINLLDTPGHHDFSEDTYRTLMAADAAVMVIDVAKGVETQTEKLFKVCALRKMPIITFVNKVDRVGMGAMEVIEDIENKFNIQAIPQTWPVGSGQDFCGVVDLVNQQLIFFDDKAGHKRIAGSTVSWADFVNDPQAVAQPILGKSILPSVIETAVDEVELLQVAGEKMDQDQYLAGQQTPVFFGSALTNFGVEHFLQAFINLCPAPADRLSDQGQISAGESDFTGFVFKIQANLDPKHRDRVAFVRGCSGRFARDMEVTIRRSGKRLRLPRALKIFGQERLTMDEAFPGDIIGLINPGEFRLGDTLCEGKPVQFEPLPQFSPEFFAVFECADTSRRKQFDRGLDQLVEEGAIQVFYDVLGARREKILAAVGELQFDVVQYRLESEYNAATRVGWKPYKFVRWFEASEDEIKSLQLPYTSMLVKDQFGHDAVLLQTEWNVKTLEKDNPKIRFDAIRLADFDEINTPLV